MGTTKLGLLPDKHVSNPLLCIRRIAFVTSGQFDLCQLKTSAYAMLGTVHRGEASDQSAMKELRSLRLAGIITGAS